MTTTEMDKYEYVKVLGSGTSAVTRLVRHKETKELLAMKCIPRGHKIDRRVLREIINHRSLWHPNIIRFKKVALTPTHLAILMEYAAGGELFDRIIHNGRFCEDEARYFFQQLIAGVSYLHKMQICHRDLKLENTLLDGSSKPQLKICDFGYSKNILLHSRTKSMVGTTAYVAPDALSIQEYDGKMTDVWACGVTLYIMLVGEYPFVDKDDKKNVRKTVGRILSVQYEIPENVHLSEECRELFSRIFIANPKKRITVKEIKEHPWFLKNLPMDLTEEAQTVFHKRSCGARAFCSQTVTEIMKIVREASIPPPPNARSGFAEDEGKEVQERKVGKR